MWMIAKRRTLKTVLCMHDMLLVLEFCHLYLWGNVCSVSNQCNVCTNLTLHVITVIKVINIHLHVLQFYMNFFPLRVHGF